MKKLLAILFVTALLLFGTTTVDIYASGGEEDDIPIYLIPMPY